MITKVAEELKNSLLDAFNKRNIVLTAKYSPELAGVSRYIKDYLISDMRSPFANVDKSVYQNALLYNIGTPQKTEVFNNLRIQHGSKLFDFNTKEGVVTESENKDGNYFTLTKKRVRSDSSNDGKVIKRRVNFLNMPMRFMIMTESIENMYDILLLLRQEIQFQNYLTVPLRLTEYSEFADELEYFIQWDINDLEIQYANFDDTALNTLEFGCTVLGGYFSNFFTEEYITDTIEITVGPLNNAKGKNS